MKKNIKYISALQIKSSNNFEKNVINLMPEGVNEVYLAVCEMKFVSTGYYKYHLILDINNETTVLNKFTHDAQAYDRFKDLEIGSYNYDRWIKNTVLEVLEFNSDVLAEIVEDLK